MSSDTGNYPFQIKDIAAEENEELFSKFNQLGYVRIGPKGYFFTKGIRKLAPNIYNMELKPDDIWIVTYPKSGTTWMSELIWLVGNDFDYTRAAAIPLFERFPFLEFSMIVEDIKIQSPLYTATRGMKVMTNSFETTSEQPSPRFIKSHMPLSLLPPALLDTCRTVYVARDPRDVAVSFYHHYKLINDYTEDFKQYWNYFVKNKIDWTPFFDHVKEAWEKRNHPNLLFFFYEDALKDLPSVVKKVSKFLGKTVTEEQLSRVCEHLSFDNFKKNKSVNAEPLIDLLKAPEDAAFVRKGKAGGWRELFDEEMKQQAEQWMAAQLCDTDLRFPTISQ